MDSSEAMYHLMDVTVVSLRGSSAFSLDALTQSSRQRMNREAQGQATSSSFPFNPSHFEQVNFFPVVSAPGRNGIKGFLMPTLNSFLSTLISLPTQKL